MYVLVIGTRFFKVFSFLREVPSFLSRYTETWVWLCVCVCVSFIFLYSFYSLTSVRLCTPLSCFLLTVDADIYDDFYYSYTIYTYFYIPVPILNCLLQGLEEVTPPQVPNLLPEGVKSPYVNHLVPIYISLKPLYYSTSQPSPRTLVTSSMSNQPRNKVQMQRTSM